MLVVITESIEQGHRTASSLLGQSIKKNPNLRLGLAAGSTPIGVYQSLVDLHRSTHLDFSGVEFFSLDEFIGLPSTSSKSYAAFFHQHLFRHINANPANIHLLQGEVQGDIASHCHSYERLIYDRGGIDVQLLGIGINGHLAFNEPMSSFRSRTRASLLSAETRETLSRTFNETEVPEWAVTMGLGTIGESRALLMLAFGKEKAKAIAQAVEGPLTAAIPASSIQLHPHAVVILDQEAAGDLKFKKYYQQQSSNLAMLLPHGLA
ncbi:MAG TPA: glucosamine-6-phosphate deaminase [Nitrospiraceae bacterium]|nr:glucosamine-6-phosphate deaminase [Nitrospiraceae bacterium]